MFSSEQEREVMRYDDVATHLIYLQDKYFIDMGKKIVLVHVPVFTA